MGKHPSVCWTSLTKMMKNGSFFVIYVMRNMNMGRKHEQPDIYSDEEDKSMKRVAKMKNKEEKLKTAYPLLSQLQSTCKCPCPEALSKLEKQVCNMEKRHTALFLTIVNKIGY